MIRRVRILPVAAFALAASFLLAAPQDAGAAGDVRVGAVTPGGDVNINGDSANNDITVTQNANGTVTITGNAGTTVNGGASHTTAKPVKGEVDIKTRGGDDKVTVDGVTKVQDITVDDTIGTNTVEVKKSAAKDKLKVKNSGGSIKIGDSRWRRRDIRPGTGTVNPKRLKGKGGAGSVGTPPAGTGGGKKPPRRKKSKGPLDAQSQGLPTNNPGQRGVVTPELPHPGPSGYGGKPPMPKKGKY